MNEKYILFVIIAYFLVLIIISFFTSRKSDNKDFFLANRQSPWYVVAFGMIGASLSGVTFISIPAWVGQGTATGFAVPNSNFSYMVMVFGYLLGYLFIAYILMPMYYRLNLTSIYTYLEKRFGTVSYKTGAIFFLVSRTIGAAFRLYLVAIVFHAFIASNYGISFPMTVFATIALIWLYTFRGGIRTIIWTDTLQTAAMLIAVVMTIYFIGQKMEMDIFQLIDSVQQSTYSQVFYWDNFKGDSRHFIKLFLGGVSIAVVMTGLDQDMMQKNLSCRNLRDAQKNMITFSVVLIFVNLIFLFLGALLYLYTTSAGIAYPDSVDLIYPTIALQHLPMAAGIIFTIGLVAAAYSSADSALTSLTTSFCVDILNFDKKNEAQENAVELAERHPDILDQEEAKKSSTPQKMKRIRMAVHLAFSLLLFGIIIVFWNINDRTVAEQIFHVAGYTYGPLLGLYFFGFFTKQTVQDKYVWMICLTAPALSYLLKFLLSYYNVYSLSFELLILNGFLTFLGLLAISHYDREMAEKGFYGL